MSYFLCYFLVGCLLFFLVEFSLILCCALKHTVDNTTSELMSLLEHDVHNDKEIPKDSMR